MSDERGELLKEFDLAPIDFTPLVWHKMKKVLGIVATQRVITRRMLALFKEYPGKGLAPNVHAEIIQLAEESGL